MRASYLRSGGSLALPTTLNCKKAISRLVPKAQARFRFVTASGRLITKLRFLGKKYIKLQGLCAALLRFASKAAPLLFPKIELASARSLNLLLSRFSSRRLL
jgi:hypothetical protein